jgi:hypothetical protein
MERHWPNSQAPWGAAALAEFPREPELPWPLFHLVQQQLDCAVECRKAKTRRQMNGATLAKLTGARGAAALAE